MPQPRSRRQAARPRRRLRSPAVASRSWRGEAPQTECAAVVAVPGPSGEAASRTGASGSENARSPWTRVRRSRSLEPGAQPSGALPLAARDEQVAQEAERHVWEACLARESCECTNYGDPRPATLEPRASTLSTRHSAKQGSLVGPLDAGLGRSGAPPTLHTTGHMCASRAIWPVSPDTVCLDNYRRLRD